MRMPLILLLEDDLLIGEQIEFTLRANNLDVLWVKTIFECETLLDSNNPDLIIFDVNIGTDSSLNLLKSLNEKNILYPTIFLSANGSDENIIKALELGANDFIHKPINNKELILRIKTHLRLLNLKPENSFEDVILDLSQATLKYQNIIISLNNRQKEIMQLFFKNTNKIIKRADLYNHLKENEEFDIRTIDSHVSQIRRKLRENRIRHISIESIYRIGYRLSSNDDEF